jgi:peroxiredoxin
MSAGHLLGSEAPNFVLPNLEGEKVELAQMIKEKPVLLVFWATWCPTCLEEIPTLNEWTKKFPQLKILGINVQESMEQIKPFASKRGVNYPVLLDQQAEVAELYGLIGIPAAIVVAKGGRIIYYGFSLPENIEGLIGV